MVDFEGDSGQGMGFDFIGEKHLFDVLELNELNG